MTSAATDLGDDAYAILPQVTLGTGARNLFDAEYVLTDGFPEQGRTLFASIRARY